MGSDRYWALNTHSPTYTRVPGRTGQVHATGKLHPWLESHGLDLPGLVGQIYLSHQGDLGPPNHARLGYLVCKHATRDKGHEISFGSLLLALSFFRSELKTNHLTQSMPKVCG